MTGLQKYFEKWPESMMSEDRKTNLFLLDTEFYNSSSVLFTFK